MSSGACDKCAKELTPVSIDVRVREGGGLNTKTWCMNCIREELHPKGSK
jgi:RNase P subunit RPR2